MRFYLFAIIIAFFQSSVLLALFHNLLTVPNLLLAYLFVNLLKEENHTLKKPIISGFLLDIFQDSLGLHLSGYTFFSIWLSFLKTRFDFPNRTSLLLTYTFLSLIEKLWVVILFRLRYYLEINPLLFLLSYAFELSFIIFISRGYFKKIHE
ncbi:MAG: hypothetical protein ACK4LT_04885 [Aquificaceae bacterium]